MNRDVVEQTLQLIRTTNDKTAVLNALIKIRTELVKDRAGIELFREVQGVPVLVRLLNKAYEPTLEVTLSILANCCTDFNSSKIALRSNVCVFIKNIIKHPSTSIQYRALRLLGNLSKTHCNEVCAVDCQATVQALCKILEESSDVLSRIMAFRCVRYLLANAIFLKHFLQANGFAILLRILNSVMKNYDEPATEQQVDDNMLKPHKSKWEVHRENYFLEVARNFENVRSDIFDSSILKDASFNLKDYAIPKQKEAQELAETILKCLLDLSQLQFDTSVWKCLQNSGANFVPIVYCASVPNENRNVALKILANFAKNPASFQALVTSDAILPACELLAQLDHSSPLNESQILQCLTLIGLLSNNACNRSKIRRSGTLFKLIAIFQRSESRTINAMILFIFNNFEYDNMSMQLIVNNGLIPLLVRELHIYLTDEDEFYQKKREEKQQQIGTKRKISDKLDYSNKCTKFGDYDSPGSSPHSYYSSSPSSSRSLSPADFTFYDNEENFSPVCSDDDDDDAEDIEGEANRSTTESNNETANNVDSLDVMRLLADIPDPLVDNLSDKEEENEKTTATTNTTSKSPRTIDLIENLLYRATLLLNKRQEAAMGSSDTIETLIKAVSIFGTSNNNFANSLTNILLETIFFNNIIKFGVIYQLYQLTKMEETNKGGLTFIDTLTCVAESNYGNAELANLLSSNNEELQKRTAIAVAYIIRSHRLLHQFLSDGNVLSILLNIILSRKYNKLQLEAADAITVMSSCTLEISMPKSAANTGTAKDALQEFDENQALHTICDMRFVLADGTSQESNQKADNCSIAFNKQLLCQSSEVFNRMLNSDFIEGKAGEIQLNSYTASGVKYFLNLIARQANNMAPNIPTASKQHAMLEAFELARCYMMPELEETVLELLMKSFNETNCLSIFEWSLKNYHSELNAMAINYYLCSNVANELKVKLFQEAEYSNNSAEWFQMIIDTVLDTCKAFIT